jgi:hypothetical protein
MILLRNAEEVTERERERERKRENGGFIDK